MCIWYSRFKRACVRVYTGKIGISAHQLQIS
jgi:hypothetical protein